MINICSLSHNSLILQKLYTYRFVMTLFTANKQKPVFALALLLVALAPAWAQGPNNSGTYYKNADGKKGSALKTAMHGIISTHKTISYDGLWSCYHTTDKRPDGKLYDMYSNTTNFTIGGPEQGRNYKKEGDGYNREHSMPKSWFGEASPMKSDLVHVVPSDGYVNNRRGNYPFGETDGDKYKSNNGYSKLGTSKTKGYSGVVFEPNDEYKGDFARIYFYMVTCYEDRVSSWNSDMLAGNRYPAFTTWALDMLLRWAANDPVSEKETKRNSEAYKLQQNRNPFVDYPGLEQMMWGDKKDVAFSYDNYNGHTGINEVEGRQHTVNIYRADGRQIRSKVAKADALKSLPKGVYIIGKKKYIVR